MKGNQVMYQWPLDQIVPMCDSAQSQTRLGAASSLASSGLDHSLVSFLAPLFDAVDGQTFFDGALRMHPLAGMSERGIPNLSAWNEKAGWKQHEPSKINDTFYFCSNGFGDLFGIPVDADGRILRDRIGILWVERYEYQEAVVEWRDFFPRLKAEPAMVKFFLRTEEFAWAAATLGKPAASECFSSNVPAMLGGSDAIENVALQSLVVHVSFTLQVILQARRQAEAGEPLGIVDLYDESGRLIP